MTTLKPTNIAVVRRYFDGCNSGKLEIFYPLSHRTLCTTFCLQAFQPYMGQSIWQGIGVNSRSQGGQSGVLMNHLAGRRVASECCLWTSPEAGRQVMSRGTEWCIVRDTLITEVRAYFIANLAADVELPDFPYAERGYLNKT